jgi:hypothetical protein
LAGERFRHKDQELVPVSDSPTPLPADPLRTSAPVRRVYTILFGGTMTAERLDLLRDAVGLSHRGDLDDDRDEAFGSLRLRDEPGTPVLLRLYRQDEHRWFVALTYQGEPPTPELLESVRTGVRAAIVAAGLVIDEEIPARS